METVEFEKRVLRLSNRGIISKAVSREIINIFYDNEDDRLAMCDCLEKIEKLNDEDSDFFIKLNQLINSMI